MKKNKQIHSQILKFREGPLLKLLSLLLFISTVVFLCMGYKWKLLYYSRPFNPFYISLFLFLISLFILPRIDFEKNSKNLMKSFIKYHLQIFILWISLGIAVSGIFMIFPPQKTIYYQEREFVRRGNIVTKSHTYYDTSYFKVSLLITVVGGILIFGLGYTSKNK